MTTSEKHDRNNILKEINIKKQKDKHPVIQKTCIGKCKKLCNLLTHEHQTTIWLDFWKLNYTERRKYMSKCVNIANIKRRKVVADINDGFRKNKSRIYTLSHPELKVEVAVCKTTFLQTLGFTNDSVVTELVAVMEKDSCGQFVKENRGKPRIDIINREPIIKHIESYNPSISHYRRKNAPNIRYLPHELTIKSMFNDFLENNQNYCDLETYRSTLKRINISLNQPKADECEDCLTFQLDPLILEEESDVFIAYTIHKNKAN